MSYIELSSLGAGVAQYQSGAVVSGKPGTIHMSGTQTAVPVYPTPGGTPDQSGDFTTDAFGKVPGWVQRTPQDYYVDITIAPAGTVTVLIPGTGSAADVIAASQHPGDYTFALSDVGTVVEGTGSVAQTFTVPTNATVAFPIGAILEVFQEGTGQITIVGAGAVTLRSDGNKTKTVGQYSTIGLRHRATDEWVLNGDLA